MLSDYPCFMDDVYAMGAECSEDDVVKSAQVGGDLAKLVVLAMVIIFALAAIVVREPILDIFNI
jgi:glutamate synthase domain-containing protein 2